MIITVIVIKKCSFTNEELVKADCSIFYQYHDITIKCKNSSSKQFVLFSSFTFLLSFCIHDIRETNAKNSSPK